jgi:hypothetical protein
MTRTTRRIVTTCLSGAALLAAFGAGAIAHQQFDAGRSADAQAIRKEIESIFQAFIDKDKPKLAATHGRNWRGYLTGSRSVIKGRDGYMRAATGDGPMEPKGQGMVGYTIQEYDTVFYGDVAVVSFVSDVDYMYGTEPWKSKLTLMDVYAKEDGRWMQVASQTSLHPDFQDTRMSEHRPLEDSQKQSLLKAREAVWRAWYGGDTAALTKLLPAELVTLHTGPGGWGTRDSILGASTAFAKSGGKLLRLEFPRTEIQRYGNTAIIYTSYELDVQEGAKRRTERGKATEVFVRRGPQWLNTGWQLAPETAGEK